LARRAKKDLPADLVATGRVQGNFTVRQENTSSHGPDFEGRGEIANLRLQSSSSKVEFAPGNLPFVLNSDRGGADDPYGGRWGRQSDVQAFPVLSELRVEFGPVALALGRPVPAQARGWVGQSGYAIAVRGDGEVAHTLRVAGLFGLPASKTSAEGTAQMNLQIAGSWAENASGNSSAFALPKVTGTVQLRNVSATMRGTNEPIEISSAELELLPDEVRVEQLKAHAADANWTGTVVLPRACGTPGACLVHFNLNSDKVGLGDLHKWLASHPSERRWYQVLTPAASTAPSFLETLRASGRLSAGRLRIHNLVAERVSGALELDHGKLKISDLRADLLGGKHRGDWQADFTAASPLYTGTGTLTGISLEQMASAMHDPWISGTGGATYQIRAAGGTSAEFWESAEGNLRFDVRDGVLPHIELASDDAPLQIGRWQGRAQLHDRKIEIQKGALVSSFGVYEVSGTASLGQELNFKLSAGAGVKSAGAGSLVYSITGTVAEPRVALIPTPQTQAQLKP
jgi:hypothetical protein